MLRAALDHVVKPINPIAELSTSRHACHRITHSEISNATPGGTELRGTAAGEFLAGKGLPWCIYREYRARPF